MIKTHFRFQQAVSTGNIPSSRVPFISRDRTSGIILTSGQELCLYSANIETVHLFKCGVPPIGRSEYEMNLSYVKIE